MSSLTNGTHTHTHTHTKKVLPWDENPIALVFFDFGKFSSRVRLPTSSFPAAIHWACSTDEQRKVDDATIGTFSSKGLSAGCHWFAAAIVSNFRASAILIRYRCKYSAGWRRLGKSHPKWRISHFPIATALSRGRGCGSWWGAEGGGAFAKEPSFDKTPSRWLYY